MQNQTALADIEAAYSDGQLKESPRRKLLDSHADQLTGCFNAARRDGLGVKLYLNDGAIIAAHADDDDEGLVTRLISRGVLRPAQVVEIRHHAGEEPLTDFLFNYVDEEMLSDLLYDRFRENIAQCIAGQGPVRFDPMDAVFVSNLQLGHDTADLLKTIDAIVERAEDLIAARAVDRKLTLSDASPRKAEEELLASLLATPLTVSELLHDSPYEEYATYDLLMEMLADAVVEFVPESAEPPKLIQPELPPVTPEVVEAAFDDHELAMFADNDYHRGRSGDGHFVKTQEELDADRVDLRDILPPHEPLTADEDEGPIALAAAEDLDDDDAAPVRKISMNFSGPRLSNEEAERKIAVANQVMSELASAFDAVRGKGFGQSQVQLLLDGCPSEFSLLFHQVEATPEGQISNNAILHNLRRRPAPEHRSLLNKGLADLINRALSAAVESLDEEHIDALLENVAGYHQRLGL